MGESKIRPRRTSAETRSSLSAEISNSGASGDLKWAKVAGVTTSYGQGTEVLRRCIENALEAKLKNPKDPTQRYMIRESYKE